MEELDSKRFHIKYTLGIRICWSRIQFIPDGCAQASVPALPPCTDTSISRRKAAWLPLSSPFFPGYPLAPLFSLFFFALT